MVKTLMLPPGIPGETHLFKLLKHFSNAPYLGAFNSCVSNLSESLPLEYYTFDWMLGIAWHEASVLTKYKQPSDEQNQYDSFYNINDLLCQNEEIKIGYFTYEMQEFSTKIKSNLPDAIGNPAPSFWFTPEVTVLCKESHISITFQNIDLCREIEDIIYKKTNPYPSHYSRKIALKPFECQTSKSEYIANIHRIQDHIKQGNIYEVNYCIEWIAPYHNQDPVSIWQNIIVPAGSPFSNFIKNQSLYILGNSPERFLKYSNKTLISQPIKGTAQRHPNNEIDKEVATELKDSPKERAEHIMIVDLVRNDLTKCSIPNTVEVVELQKVFSFKNVHQLISTVKSQCSPNTPLSKILLAMYPMGSMTGAPKIKACQFIEKIEKRKRGVYSGTIG
ncbi:MAG: chorismate-binding protein, partial [Bacteroidota bacterium]